MDLSVGSKREYVRIQLPIFGVLLNIVAEPGSNSAIVPLNLAIGLQMIRFCEHLHSPHVLQTCWKNFEVYCPALIEKAIALQSIGHNPMGYKGIIRTLRYNSPDRNSTEEFRETVRYNQEVLAVPWAFFEFKRNVDCKEIHESESDKDLCGLTVPAKVHAVPGTSDKIT